MSRYPARHRPPAMARRSPPNALLSTRKSPAHVTSVPMIASPTPASIWRETRSPSRRFPRGVTMIGWSDTSRTLAATDVYCSEAVQRRKWPARKTPLTSTRATCLRPLGSTPRRASRTTHGASSTVAIPMRSQTIVAASSFASLMRIAEKDTATVATTSAQPAEGVRWRATARLTCVARDPAP